VVLHGPETVLPKECSAGEQHGIPIRMQKEKRL